MALVWTTRGEKLALRGLAANVLARVTPLLEAVIVGSADAPTLATWAATGSVELTASTG